jgi:hypothetical protein
VLGVFGGVLYAIGNYPYSPVAAHGKYDIRVPLDCTGNGVSIAHRLCL